MNTRDPSWLPGRPSGSLLLPFYSVFVMRFVPTVPWGRGAGRFLSGLPSTSAWERGPASEPGPRLVPSTPRPEVTTSRKPLSPGMQGGEGPPPSVGLPQLPLAGPFPDPRTNPNPSALALCPQAPRSHRAQHCGRLGHLGARVSEVMKDAGLGGRLPGRGPHSK